MYAHPPGPIFSRKLILLMSVERPHPLVEVFYLLENTNVFQATLDSKYALETSKLQ